MKRFETHLKQNEVAERKDRTLVETSQCLLIDFESKSACWAQAIINVMNYNWNTCPLRNLKGKISLEKCMEINKLTSKSSAVKQSF